MYQLSSEFPRLCLALHSVRRTADHGCRPTAGFHVRQALKIQIAALLSLVLAIIPFLGWVAAFACKIIAIVINLICFFRVCSGKAIEAPIVSSFKFLK